MSLYNNCLGTTSGCSTSHRHESVFVLWTRTDPRSIESTSKQCSFSTRWIWDQWPKVNYAEWRSHFKYWVL